MNHRSKIIRVQRTKDKPGWIVTYDDGGKKSLRVSSKWGIYPRRGETIEVYGLPNISAVVIGGHTLFRRSVSENDKYYDDLWTATANLREIEDAIASMKANQDTKMMA